MKYLRSIVMLAFFLASCGPWNELDFSGKPHYRESNKIHTDSLFILTQKLCDFKVDEFDASVCHIFRFAILDAVKAKEMRVLDFGKDTNVIQADFMISAMPGPYSAETYDVAGTLEIESWQDNKVIVQENIILHVERIDGRYGTKPIRYRRKFKGTRSFSYAREADEQL